MATYCVATIGRHHHEIFESTVSKIPGDWRLVSDPAEFTRAWLDALKPRAVFLPHWLWKVPADIISDFKCIGFHSTALSFGRGGTPIQNMIALGHESMPPFAA